MCGVQSKNVEFRLVDKGVERETNDMAEARKILPRPANRMN